MDQRRSRHVHRKPGICGTRSGYYGMPKPHKFSSHRKVTSPSGEVLLDTDSCSWCTHPRPTRGKKQ